MLFAFVDESMRRGPDGVYVMAAVLVGDRYLDAADAVLSVLLPGQKRFHWRDESERQRIRMLHQAAAASESEALAYVRRKVPPAAQARARAQCIRRLVSDLWALDCNIVIFESREPRNDRKDQATIGHAQRAGEASPELRFAFDRPDDMCLLWLADAVAGAVSSAVSEEATRYVEVLGDWLRIIDLEA